MKRCRKCGQEKDESLFMKDRRLNGGIASRCKECAAKSAKQWYHANTEKVKETWKKSYPAKREKIMERVKKWCQTNKDKRFAIHRRWYEKNKEDKKIKDRERRILLHDHYRKLQNLNAKRRRREDVKYHLSCRVSRAMHGSLSGGAKAGRRWDEISGYSVEDLKKHLEKQFLPGMTWENYGQWQIDHIIPISAFNYKTPDDLDFKRCWSLNNLRPLWREDNLRKSDALQKPFQPALAIAV